MPKQLFRTVENLLDSIDHAAGSEAMLRDVLNLLVNDQAAQGLGVISGRLYRERKLDYLLIYSLGEYGPSIAGKSVRKDYQVVQDIERRRLWVISPESPGFDPDVESQFSGSDTAAILVGRDPAYILSLGIEHHGSEQDLQVLLQTIRAAVSLKLREQAFADQMMQARAIQLSLLPRSVPNLNGFDIGALSFPAEEVGGDVYDLQVLDEGLMGFLLADASGHGLPAALQARDVVIGMRMGQANQEKIAATVSRLNKVIHASAMASRFISLFYGELEQNGNLAYINGGHCPPLLFTKNGDVYELKTCGPVLGPLPDAQYGRGFLTMRPGELLVLFTDGVTERLDATTTETDDDIVEFGTEGLIEVVKECMEEPAEIIVETILDRVRDFGGRTPLDDDVSLIVIRRLDADAYPPVEDLTRVVTGTRR